MADILQIPAFLCRQTVLIEQAAATGKWVNIKKGQFLSPEEMTQVANKAIAAGGEGRIMVCERGASFGYNNLVVDMRSLAIMRNTGCPVVFDVTHSVQQPGGHGTHSGGNREFVPVLARAAIATGVSGLFMETHPDPDKALSDGPNSWPLNRMRELLQHLQEIDQRDICYTENGACLTSTNGELECNEVVHMQIRPLNEGTTPFIFASSPDVLTIGYRCVEKGYGFHWNPYSLFTPPSFDRTELRFIQESKTFVPTSTTEKSWPQAPLTIARSSRPVCRRQQHI